VLIISGGTTKEFCGDKTVKAPSCSGTSSSKRTIAYYEGWNQDRTCDGMKIPSKLMLCRKGTCADFCI